MYKRRIISILIYTSFCFALTGCNWFNKQNKPKKADNGLSNANLFGNKGFTEDKNAFTTVSYTRESEEELVVQKVASQNSKGRVLEDNRCYHEANLWNRNHKTPSNYRILYNITGTFSQTSSTIKKFEVAKDYQEDLRYSYDRLIWQDNIKTELVEFDAPARMLPEFALLKFFMNQAKSSSSHFKVNTKSMTKKYNDQYSRVIETKKRLKVGPWRCRDHVKLYLEHSDYVSPAEQVRNDNGIDPRIIALSKGDYSMLQYSDYDQEYVLDIKYSQENNITYSGSYLARHIRCKYTMPMFAKNLRIDRLGISCKGNRLTFKTID